MQPFLTHPVPFSCFCCPSRLSRRGGMGGGARMAGWLLHLILSWAASKDNCHMYHICFPNFPIYNNMYVCIYIYTNTHNLIKWFFISYVWKARSGSPVDGEFWPRSKRWPWSSQQLTQLLECCPHIGSGNFECLLIQTYDIIIYIYIYILTYLVIIFVIIITIIIIYIYTLCTYFVSVFMDGFGKKGNP